MHSCPSGFIHSNTPGNIDDGPGLRQLLGTGLQDAEGAEVHIIIRNHGPANGNPEQTTFNIGNVACNNEAN